MTPDGKYVHCYAAASIHDGDVSPDEQRQRCIDYAGLHRIGMIDSFIPDSATEADRPIEERPGGMELIKRLRVGDHVIALGLVVVARDLKEFSLVLKRLQGMKVTLHLAELGGAIEPSDRFSTRLAESMLDLQAKERGRKIKEGHARRKRTVPKLRASIPTGMKEKFVEVEGAIIRAIVDDDQEQDVMRLIMDMRIIDNLTFGEIAAALNAMGRKKRNKRPFEKQTVAHIFKLNTRIALGLRENANERRKNRDG